MIVSPQGRLHVECAVDGEAAALAEFAMPVAESAARRVCKAFSGGTACGLLHVATVELQTALPACLAYVRDVAKEYLTALCHAAGADGSGAGGVGADDAENVGVGGAGVSGVSEIPSVPPPSEEVLAFRVLQAPPMMGLEYLSGAVLQAWWRELDAYVRGQIRDAAVGTAGAANAAAVWLRERNPLWRLVGRVTFHLAENKRDEQCPFAFMASYASRLSAQGRVQHVPLGRALQEYAGAKNRQALIALLSPVQAACERSESVKALVESGDVYRPLAWTARQAYGFLQDIPAMEAAGLIVRVPDWWKAKRPPRPVVNATIGQRAGAGLGIESLLDYSVGVHLDGESLSDAEVQALLSTEENLVRLKGQWVEMDRQKLSAALAHWKQVEAQVQSGGLTFFEGMRLLSGVDVASGAGGDAGGDGDVERSWSRVTAGEWLERTLAQLRDPRQLDGEPPPGLCAVLRPYQNVGVRWLGFLTQLRLGACLADDMGLGKTVQILALLLNVRAARIAEDTAGLPHSCDAGVPPACPEGVPPSQTLANRQHDPLWPAQRGQDARETRGRDARATEKLPPSLLVVPASLIANWKAEIERFAPALSVWIAHPSEQEQCERDPAGQTHSRDAGVSPARVADILSARREGVPPSQTPADTHDVPSWPVQRGRDARVTGNASTLHDPGPDLDACDLVITTYGMAARLAWLREREWNLAILDEAQAIKNSGTRQTRAVKELHARARVALTGTPVENRLGDLWSLFDFLNPGLLGTAKEFADYAKALQSREHNPYGPLRSLVRPYILRRLKTDRSIIADLPDKTEMKAFCCLSRRQATIYEQSVRELAAQLERSDGIQRKGIVLSFLMRLKQICNHPSQWLGDNGYEPADSGKFQRLADLCHEVAQRQEKALIFTQFREIADPLASHLQNIFGRPGLVLHGQTPVAKRREMVTDFQREDGPPFFVLSLKAGGVGLNLTAASHVIHFDRWWNPAVENQATDRAFRIGQTRNVLVHKFICQGTVEEKIDKLIEDKLSLSADLLADTGGEKLLTEMTNPELLRFVALDISKSADT